MEEEDRLAEVGVGKQRKAAAGKFQGPARGTATHTWRIIPVSKWLVTPIYKPFRPFGRGTTLLRGLTNYGY